ncbi:RNA polymerase sigma factor SigF [Nocardioides zeae]|uniref:RNA polymerase sigma factor SigF n=1 Tax=Nocardioides imazamoxiresistens TaxID=3231893 RepID=A0ABU3PWT7_9ACTN|nr:RNA polymerase sigma factor SigF [Nocardioides zeae]MDT9593703.1 RNA polymerase sigma factor SigF [Nocardioides zeae]
MTPTTPDPGPAADPVDLDDLDAVAPDLGDETAAPAPDPDAELDDADDTDDTDAGTASSDDDPPPAVTRHLDARSIGIEQTRIRSAELFGELRDDFSSDAVRQGARDGLVHLHLPLVEHCARRFRNRGEPFEDLVQVGTIGLLKSIDRFDTERGVEFSTYATPTIIGEIKRHFRDKGWAIRVPRRLQELRMQISSATAELTQKLGRSPTVSELAASIGCTSEEIVEGIESSNAYSTLSLDATDNSDDSTQTMLDTIGVDDENLEHVEVRESLKPLLDQLPAREKKILLLRFFKNMTQSQIAAEIGVSQMHVSRLLARTLEQLRTNLQAED